MRYELTDLRVFVAIAEARSLSAGAADVHLTAPAASYRLKNLEQAVGAPLFLRTQKGMVLTPAGSTVLRRAKAILAHTERLDSEMLNHVNGVKGQLRVFANSSTMHRLSAALSTFLGAYPNVDIDLEERLSELTVKAVLEGAADVGLVAGPIELRGLEATSYGRDELIFVLPPGHPLSRRRKISLETALAHDIVSVGRKSSNFLFLEQMAVPIGIQPRVRVHAPSFAVVLRCVHEGAGISLVPRSIAVEAIRDGLVEAVALEEVWALREQRVVVRDMARLPEYAQDFVRYVARPEVEV